MNKRITFELKPPERYSCVCCRNWKRYPPWCPDLELYSYLNDEWYGKESNWGACTLDKVPRYMHETHYSRGCNFHSAHIAEKRAIADIAKAAQHGQLSLF